MNLANIPAHLNEEGIPHFSYLGESNVGLSIPKAKCDPSNTRE